MVGYRELWDGDTRDMIGAHELEAGALKVVRDLVGRDYSADELVLLFDDPARPVEGLPPVIAGADPAARAGLSGPDGIRRPD